MTKHRNIPVKEGVRRHRTKMPMISNPGDQAVVKYQMLGNSLSSSATVGGAASIRAYIPGNGANLVNPSGPSIVSFYSTGRFLPGTSVKWEPACSFTTSGRVIIGFTDNPEIMTTIFTAYQTFMTSGLIADFTAYLNQVRSLGSVVSFPVWQETQIPFPTRLRRKRFDVNSNVVAGVNEYDRSAQTFMFCAVEGVTLNTTIGGFLYRDHVDVEGITGVAT